MSRAWDKNKMCFEYAAFLPFNLIIYINVFDVHLTSVRLQFKINVLKYTLKPNLWWQSWICSMIMPVFSVSWFFRKSFQYTDLLLKTCLLSVLKTVVWHYSFVGKQLFQNSFINRKKNCIYLEKVNTLTLLQKNPLLINLIQKKY